MNQSSMSSSYSNLSPTQPLNHQYLHSLHQKQTTLQSLLTIRKQEKRKASLLFQDYIKRQMQMLLKEREKMSERNESFLAQSKKYSVEIKKTLPQLIEKENQLKARKIDYVEFLDKMVRRQGGGGGYNNSQGGTKYVTTVSVKEREEGERREDGEREIRRGSY